ncbi:MAG: DUF1822 family protein [Oscillatoriophycideae cyanobacterium NC_groundwater_1537_Pr4_S-0.65um_50_18]|nr:DUF1822 family protein [Oscillatoriophycideae cyanobacterium NC_groundwater_1537_Pr4_S-0.65um_50_18]
MTNVPSSPINSRLLLPEVIWLEPEQIEQAKAMSEFATSEMQRWQSYLNALALLSFEQWLSERLPEQPIQRSDTLLDSVGYVEASGFKFCLIAVEHVLDETVQIPQAVVEQPALTAHFYVLCEVSEEQELVTVRGSLRFDELIDYRDRHNFQIQNGCYSLPLSLLDTEPNHLLFYCRALQPSAIALPSNASTIAADSVSVALPVSVVLKDTTTRLTQWLQGTFEQNWQMIDQLINPDASLALGTRSIELGAKRGKLINLGVQLGQQTVALLVNVTLEAEGKLAVSVQLHPTGESRYLTPDLRLSLRSSSGKMLQEVVSRSQDNYIQLRSFKGKPGKRFSVAICLGSERIEENFEL